MTLELVKQIKAMHYFGLHHPSTPGYYREAGQALLALKAADPDWLQIVEEQCGIGRSRAYELMVIANQNKSLDEMRAETAARKIKSRKNKWLSEKMPRRKGSKSPVLAKSVRDREAAK